MCPNEDQYPLVGVYFLSFLGLMFQVFQVFLSLKYRLLLPDESVFEEGIE